MRAVALAVEKEPSSVASSGAALGALLAMVEART